MTSAAKSTAPPPPFVEHHAAQARQRSGEHKPDRLHRHGSRVITFTITQASELGMLEFFHARSDRLQDQAATDAMRGAAPFPSPPLFDSLNSTTFTLLFEFRRNVITV